jgi:hypothetical protein
MMACVAMSKSSAKSGKEIFISTPDQSHAGANMKG